MLQREHSAILSTFIIAIYHLIIVIKIFVLSILEWLFYTGLLYYTEETEHCKLEQFDFCIRTIMMVQIGSGLRECLPILDLS